MAIIINRIGLLNVSIDRSIDSFLIVWHHFIYRILSTLLYKFQHFDLFFKHNLIVHRLSTRVFLPHFVSSFQILILIQIVREREEQREKEIERESVCVFVWHMYAQKEKHVAWSSGIHLQVSWNIITILVQSNRSNNLIIDTYLFLITISPMSNQIKTIFVVLFVLLYVHDLWCFVFDVPKLCVEPMKNRKKEKTTQKDSTKSKKKQFKLIRVCFTTNKNWD